MSLVKGQCVSGTARKKVNLKGSTAWAKSGGFLCSISATAGHARPAVQTDTYISGWMDIGFDPSDSNISSDILTVPATSTEKYAFNLIDPRDGVFRIPVTTGQTLAATHGGLACTIEVNSSKQTVDLADTTIRQVIILPPSAEDIAENVATVIINPAVIGRSTTA